MHSKLKDWYSAEYKFCAVEQEAELWVVKII